VSAIILDSNVVIYAGERRQHEFRIESNFSLVNDMDGSSIAVEFDPYTVGSTGPCGITELAGLVPRIILRSFAYMDGSLDLVFSESLRLAVPSSADFEPWSYTFGSFLLHSPAGGFE
jgi:hypothetical protein